MSFALDSHWVWDFWVADDGDLFHLYYLYAPKTLGDQRLRHRNARIGHATSADLVSWVDHGTVLPAGAPGEFDETATWTGSVLRAADGTWRMFYTGTRFLSPDSAANIQTVGVATSTDLHTWTKLPGSIVSADPRWYETMGDSTWPEEAWRDPWVFADPGGNGWHMLVTARANKGDERDRGVIAHATSRDLDTWEVHPPLSAAGSGFTHLEVPQIALVDGHSVLVFSCDTAALAGIRHGETGGTWVATADSATGPYDLANATLLVDESLYSGRLVRNREGDWLLLAFENMTERGGFVGRISDPMPFCVDSITGAASLGTAPAERA